MSIEQLMQSVLTASPAMRRRLESVLNGTDTTSVETPSGTTETRLLTISGAARLLNVNRNVIGRLIATDRLDAVDLNGSRRVTMRSVMAFANGERPANEKTEALIAQHRAMYHANKAKSAADDMTKEEGV